MNRGQLLSGPGKYHYSSNESSVSGTTSYDEKHVVLPLSTSLPRLSSLPYSGTSKAASNVITVLIVFLIALITFSSPPLSLSSCRWPIPATTVVSLALVMSLVSYNTISNF